MWLDTPQAQVPHLQLQGGLLPIAPFPGRGQGIPESCSLSLLCPPHPLPSTRPGGRALTVPRPSTAFLSVSLTHFLGRWAGK